MSNESQHPAEDEITPGEEAGDDLLPADDLLADEPSAIREELRRKLKTEGARGAIDTPARCAQGFLDRHTHCRLEARRSRGTVAFCPTSSSTDGSHPRWRCSLNTADFD